MCSFSIFYFFMATEIKIMIKTNGFKIWKYMKYIKVIIEQYSRKKENISGLFFFSPLYLVVSG